MTIWTFIAGCALLLLILPRDRPKPPPWHTDPWEDDDRRERERAKKRGEKQ